MKNGDFSQLDDYDVPFREQQYLYGSCYISLLKLKSFDQLIPPKLPQISDIYSAVAPQVKSVQSALSDLKRPPERLQSPCNYRLFIT